MNSAAVRDSECFELRGDRTEEDLTCAICYNLFSIPKTLACGHSFCGTCINRVIQNSVCAKILCPKCKAQHSKHTLTNRLELNLRLQTAVMKLQSQQIPKFLPQHLVPIHQIQSSGLFFKEQVMAITVLANEDVCFTTNSSIYCHSTTNGVKSLVWCKGMADISSIASNERHIFVSQRTDDLHMVAGRYTCWIIHVLNYKGLKIGQLHGGLGQDCSVTALPDGWLAVADTGSYTLHAQPCLILMTEVGDDMQVLTAESQKSAMIKPTKVLASSDRSQLIVFDGGDNYLKCYRSLSNNLRKCWQARVNNYATMTMDSTNSVIVVVMRQSLNVMAFSGENIASIDYSWDREVVRDVSIHGSHLAVCVGKKACVYNVVGADDRCVEEEV